VEYAHGQARINGSVIDLVDLPGLYSLNSATPAEVSGREFLLAREWDVLINVVDASQLARSLELTLELLDLGAPLVVCLNMMDEAVRKGMIIDSKALMAALDVPVVEAVASRGRGIVETFRAALTRQRQVIPPQPFRYAREAETTIQLLAEALEPLTSECYQIVGAHASPRRPPLQRAAGTVCAQAEPSVAVETPPLISSPRFQALQLIQSDPEQISQLDRCQAAAVEEAQSEIMRLLGRPADVAISSARHAACLNLFERVVRVTKPRADWRERLDRAVMDPVWGYLLLALVFLGFFQAIFNLGKIGETHAMALFDALLAWLAQHMDPAGVAFASLKGALLGTAGAVAAVLPYLLPFLIGLAVLEDIGYLARVGYLMDVAMHRVGLHGTATLPVLLGYGCSVPAVMATRILASRRDRFIASFLAVLVPCSARMTVIFALVGFYLGANYALGIYALNFLVVMLVGHQLARIWPEISPGMLMEVPAYRIPSPRVVLRKTWWRLREFMVVAFPLLVASSAVLSLIEFYGWQQFINAMLSPLTALLGLPRVVGLTLIFGVLRKELSLLMLMQALGTTHVLSAMTAAQIVIFTLFVTFYLPCMATLASMMRELGWRLTTAAAGALLGLAVAVSLAAHLFVVLW
jgi:ferrous iron transport protein B